MFTKKSPTGLDMIFKFFKNEFYDTEGTQIKFNDFSNLESYFMLKVDLIFILVKFIRALLKLLPVPKIKMVELPAMF